MTQPMRDDRLKFTGPTLAMTHTICRVILNPRIPFVEVRD
jgi:hypothetical protein